MKNKKNKSIFIFYVYNFLINARFSRGVLLLYCLKIGLSLAEFGTIQSAYFLVKMLAEIPTGILADRFSKKKILGLGALISSVSSFFLFLAPNFFISPNFYVILLLFSLDSLGGALNSGTDQAMLFEYLKTKKTEDKFIKILGNTQIIGLIVLALSTAVGGKIFSFSFSTVFLLQFIFYLLAAINILFFKRSTDVSVKAEKSSNTIITQIRISISELQTKRMLAIIIVFLTLFEFYVNSLVTFIPGSLFAIGFNETAIAVIIGSITLVGVVGSYLSRYLKHISIQQFLIIFSLLFVTTSVLIATNNKVMVLLGFTVINLLLDAAYPYISDMINKSVKESVRTTILSFSNSLIGVVSLIFYPLIGWLIDKFDYSLSFLSTGIIIFVIMIALICSDKVLKQEKV